MVLLQHQVLQLVLPGCVHQQLPAAAAAEHPAGLSLRLLVGLSAPAQQNSSRQV
jgi:hypothetical protein